MSRARAYIVACCRQSKLHNRLAIIALRRGDDDGWSRHMNASISYLERC